MPINQLSSTLSRGVCARLFLAVRTLYVLTHHKSRYPGAFVVFLLLLGEGTHFHL